jgi:tRNA (guanosine-2'-O-)-methyltransferase
MRYSKYDQVFDPELLAYFSSFLTENRQMKFREVLSKRTKYITVMLEDISHSQNASAILRTCDLTGVMDVHIVENKFRYEVNPDVTVGSTQWLRMTKFNKGKNNTADAISHLKSKGYRIVATSPHHENFSPETLPLDKPVAIIFGTEKEGLSEEAVNQADAFIRIPMVGFTESYNVSVSAAIVLYTLTNRMRSMPVEWQITEEEKNQILLNWSRTSVKRPDLMEAEFNRLRTEGKLNL